MGLFTSLFGKKSNVEVKTDTWYQTFTEYAPIFTRFKGNIYSQELTRTAIESFATACSKLKPLIKGNSKPHINKLIETQPNEFMTWSVFLARLATIYEIETTAFIVPGFSRDMKKITALFPLACRNVEILEYRGEPWVKFNFANGQVAALELKYVCIIPKYQYESDFFGDPNCLERTMQLIHAQGEAQDSAIKNGAKIRFIGAVNGRVSPEDLKKKKEQFVEDNFGSDNEGGLLTYDNTFVDIKQVEPQSYVISHEEMDRIEQSVFNYFGTNEKILQNKYNEEEWSAYYEGKVAPWAIKVSDSMNRMLFSRREQAMNEITLTTSRLDYTSMKVKNSIIMNQVDRGILSLNEAREMLQLPPVEGGDKRVIRGEYVNVDALPNRRSMVSGADFADSYADEKNEPQEGEEDAN